MRLINKKDAYPLYVAQDYEARVHMCYWLLQRAASTYCHHNVDGFTRYVYVPEYDIRTGTVYRVINDFARRHNRC